MERKIRSIIFIVPDEISAAADASEMSADFLSKVDWLADDLHSIGTEIRREILHAMRRSIEAARSQVAVTIDVFQEDCVIRVSRHGHNPKQVTLHLMRDSATSPELDESLSVNQEACVS